MSSLRVETFLFDDENEEKIINHDLSPRRVAQVLESLHIILRNRKRRRGIYLIIGRDKNGVCISIPIERTLINGQWRPITAWPSKKGEETILKKYER